MNEGIRLESDLWLDQPDGADRLRRQIALDRLSPDEGAALHDFLEKGYLRFRLSDAAGPIDRLLTDVNGIWKSRPADVAYRFVGEPQSLADANERRERMAPTTLLDLHAHSSGALELYLHPEIFAWAELILQRKALAFESVFSEFGRSEAPYRDLVYFETHPASHLLTAWVALEDIEPAAGPVYVVSGSHRLPFYEFEPGRFRIRPDEDHLPARRFAAALSDRSGLVEEDLTLRKGEVVIWHPALLHGARRILRPWMTRRGFMIRLTSLGSMKSRRASFFKNVRGKRWKMESRLFWSETDRFLERNGCAGLDSPLRGLRPRGLSLREKIRSRFAART